MKQADADEKGDGADCGTSEYFRIIYGKRNDRKENDDAHPYHRRDNRALPRLGHSLVRILAFILERNGNTLFDGLQPHLRLVARNCVACRGSAELVQNPVRSGQFEYICHHRETIIDIPDCWILRGSVESSYSRSPRSLLNSHSERLKRTGRSNQKLQPGRNYMFLLGIGLGRSKGLILNHIFLGITALLFMSGVAHASDGEDLLKAAYAGDLAQVRALLEKGADIDHQAQTGATALIIASQNGHEGIVQALLARGAEINHQTNDGATALYIASQNGHEGIVQALLARRLWGFGPLRVEIDHQAKNGVTALLIASQNGHEGIVQALLARGADVELQANNGATAFSMASQQGHEEIVKALLAEGANVELQANNGATALSVAKTQIRQLLKAAGATQ